MPPIHRNRPPNGKDQMKKTLEKTLAKSFDAITARQAQADRFRAERDAMILARRKSNTLEGTLEAVWDTLNGPNGGAFGDRDIRPAGGPSPGRSPAPQFHPVPPQPPARAPLPLYAPTPEPSPPVLPGLFGLGAQASAAGFPGTINQPPTPQAPVAFSGNMANNAHPPAQYARLLDPGSQLSDAIDSIVNYVNDADTARYLYPAYAAVADFLGWDYTADHLKLFLAGNRRWGGQPPMRHYSREQARQIPTVLAAERTNMVRFRDSLTTKRRRPTTNLQWNYDQKLPQLSDGETKIFDAEYWDVNPTTLGQLALGNPDYAFGFGKSNIRSVGALKATRRGNRIYIDWPITHTFKDRYDFESGRFLADGALALENHRGARPFNIRAAWKQRLEGTIDIINGKLVNPQLKWNDVN